MWKYTETQGEPRQLRKYILLNTRDNEWEVVVERMKVMEKLLLRNQHFPAITRFLETARENKKW